MQVYSCHYVNRTDPGDLLWGYHWRDAVLVVEGDFPAHQTEADCRNIEANMFDKETGQNVGDTRNFCVNRRCNHEDCGPATLIAEVD